MMNIKTVIHTYRFNLDEETENTKWQELKAKLEGQGLKCFETHGGKSHYLTFTDIDGQEIALDTKYLFDDQWNTEPIPGFSELGHRVYDWAKDYPSTLSGCQKNIARGHYLEQTEEMKRIRENTLACGYCGWQAAYGGNWIGGPDVSFCPKCQGNEYLKEGDLYLLRLKKVNDTSRRKPLTKEEMDYLLPRYIEAQTKAGHSRHNTFVKERKEKINKEYTKELQGIETKRDGFLWLLNKGINIENCIYYGHTDTFSFGWRNPLSDNVKEELEKQLELFPFNYKLR